LRRGSCFACSVTIGETHRPGRHLTHRSCSIRRSRPPQALIQAAQSNDISALLEIFGPGGKDFVSSTDPVRDKHLAAAFAAKAQKKNVVTIDPEKQLRRTR
jgi:hypothetical protein